MRAAAIVLAMAGSFCTMLAIARPFTANTSPAMLSAILALSLARRAPERRALHWSLFPFAVAATGIIAGAEGLLLHALPIAGAVVFVTALFLSVYLRNFGARGGAVGSLVALPFIAMLVVPATRTPGARGPLLDLAFVACAGFVAIAFATLAQSAVSRAASPVEIKPERAKTSAGPSPATRMALQMAVALTLAFAAGFTTFRGHWGWTVLTAFIVCSGAIGRADALWKALLRVAGALAGTAAATLAIHVWRPHGVAEAAGIFSVLFVALWLRETNYAYWAAGMTLVFALLSEPSPSGPLPLLFERLAAVLAGAFCAVFATWFVLPIRTVGVVRRRLADALLALDEFVANAHVSSDERERRLRAYTAHLASLERVAVPLRIHRRVVASADHPEHPGRWIDLAHRCHEAVETIGDRELEPKERGIIRRAIGQARKAIGAYGKPETSPPAPTIGTSLFALERALCDVAARRAP